MKSYIQRLNNKENLTASEMEEIMQSVMSGSMSEEDTGSFLIALRDKGATIEEITSAARVMRKFAIQIKSKRKPILDTCGTGGDKKNTFNISTVVAFVVAGAGVTVAKHGNRSVSSKCGSADVLEALGVNLRMEEEHLMECLDSLGIAFLFAQNLHPAMKNVAPVRKKLGVETIFNILGPLTNPANATHQMIGVYNRDLLLPMAEVLKRLGLKRGIIVHGSDGLDEITTTGKTYICEYNGKEILSYDIFPEELGIPIASAKDLEGGDLKTNVRIIQDILDRGEGPQRNIVLLNAAYALYTAEKMSNISDALNLAQDTIDSGKAKKKLEELIAFTQKHQ